MRYFYIMLILFWLAFLYAFLFHRDYLRSLVEEDPNIVVVHRERSDIGTIRVEEERRPRFVEPRAIYYKLLYCGTLHDMQCRTTDQELVQAVTPALMVNHAVGTICWYDAGCYEMPNRLEPLTYYHRSGPLGQLFPAVCSGAHERAPVAITGVGGGAVAAHARPGQPFTFYEVDPALIRVAREYFTYLRDSPGKLDFVVGEPRAKLAQAPDRSYRLIVVNPVGGEFTPVNCLTREAIQLFLRKLTDDGVVALHISNRYLNQAPVLGNIVGDLMVAGLHQFDDWDGIPGKNSSEWVLISRKKESFGPLLKDPRWQVLQPDPAFPLWTDQEQDLKAVRWKK